MLWQGRRESGNVEDRRGIGGPVAVGGGIIGVIVLVLNFLLGGNGDTSQIPLPGAGGAFKDLATIASAPNTVTTSFAGLKPGTAYEWYATVSDGHVTRTGVPPARD